MHTIVTMGCVHLSLHSNILPKSRVKKRLIQLACLLELSLNKERLMASSTRRYFRICVRDHEWVIVFRLTAPEQFSRISPKKWQPPLFSRTSSEQFLFVLFNVVTKIIGKIVFTGHYAGKMILIDLTWKQNKSEVLWTSFKYARFHKESLKYAST